MQHIVFKDNGERAYEFEDSVVLIITNTGINVGNDFIIGDMNASNASIMNDAEYLKNLRSRLKKKLSDRAEAELEKTFLFNGLPLSPAPKNLPSVAIAERRPRASRKIVTARGEGRAIVSDAEFQAVFSAMESRGQTIHDNWYDKLDAIDAATTLAELDAIDINTGWPT